MRVEARAGALVDFTEERMPVSESAAVRQWGISFIVERETAQIIS